MIVSFNSRGKGGGSGPVDYLCGKDRKREGMTVLSGNPEITRQLIDSSTFAQKYTSGVLSFSEQHDSLSIDQKHEIMKGLEHALLNGLEKDQYDILWVEHTDKNGRLELNFVIPELELKTGKRLQAYYDPVDRGRVDCFKQIINHQYNLHDPDDPVNRQSIVLPKNLSKEKGEAQKAITQGLLAQCAIGTIKNRADVIRELEGIGFEIARETKSSISIKNPTGGQNIRLKGAIYERSFKNGAGLREEIEAASEQYRRSSAERFQRVKREYKHRSRTRAEYLHSRYGELAQQARSNSVAPSVTVAPDILNGNVSNVGDMVREQQLQINANADSTRRKDEVGRMHSVGCGSESMQSSVSGEPINDSTREAAFERVERFRKGVSRHRKWIQSTFNGFGVELQGENLFSRGSRSESIRNTRRASETVRNNKPTVDALKQRVDAIVEQRQSIQRQKELERRSRPSSPSMGM